MPWVSPADIRIGDWDVIVDPSAIADRRRKALQRAANGAPATIDAPAAIAGRSANRRTRKVHRSCTPRWCQPARWRMRAKRDIGSGCCDHDHKNKPGRKLNERTVQMDREPGGNRDRLHQSGHSLADFVHAVSNRGRNLQPGCLCRHLCSRGPSLIRIEQTSGSIEFYQLRIESISTSLFHRDHSNFPANKGTQTFRRSALTSVPFLTQVEFRLWFVSLR